MKTTLSEIIEYIDLNSKTLDPNSRYVKELLDVVKDCQDVDDYEARISNKAEANQLRMDGSAISSGGRGLSWVDEDVWKNMNLFEKTLANMVTGETRMMFRFQDSDLKLIEPIFKTLADESGKLKVLSLPCSTGKEAFSYAILGLKAGLDIQVVGIDKQLAYLKKARSGSLVYHFRDQEFPDYQRWLEVHSSTNVSVKPEVLERCSFRYGDILGTLPTDSYDFVACQNLLGYFQPDKMLEAVENLDSRLRAGGVLFLDRYVADEKPELSTVLKGWLNNNRYNRMEEDTGLFLKLSS